MDVDGGIVQGTQAAASQAPEKQRVDLERFLAACFFDPFLILLSMASSEFDMDEHYPLADREPGFECFWVGRLLPNQKIKEFVSCHTRCLLIYSLIFIQSSLHAPHHVLGIQ